MKVLPEKYIYKPKDKTYYIKPKYDWKDVLEVEIGDSKDIKSFNPQVKIKRWDNEVNFSARLIDDEVTVPKIDYKDNKIIWENNKKELHFYEDDVDFTEYYKKDWFSFETSLGGISKGRIVNDTAFIYYTKATPEDNKLLEKTVEKLSKERNIDYIEIPSQTEEVVSIFKHFVNKGLLSNPEFNEYSKDYPSRWTIVKQYKSLIVNDFYNEEILEKIENAFEFEVVLKEKPTINKVKFTLETKGLEFFYQPELTEVEKRQGTFRPDHVVGSYAVYYKDCPKNITGGKEYKAGKAFHIYRPRINDSSGKSVWGELNIDVKKKLLTVTIPQEFLNNAIYPINHAAGLTFGFTSVGGTATPNNGGDFIRGSRFASGGVGTGNSISVYFGGKDSGKGVVGGLYTNSGTTETVVTNGGTAADTSGVTADWVTMNFSTGPTIANQNYDICALVEGVEKGGTNNMAYDTITDLGIYEDGLTYPTLPSSFTNNAVGFGFEDRKHSIYVTYSASGTTTSTSTSTTTTSTSTSSTTSTTTSTTTTSTSSTTSTTTTSTSSTTSTTTSTTTTSTSSTTSTTTTSTSTTTTSTSTSSTTSTTTTSTSTSTSTTTTSTSTSTTTTSTSTSSTTSTTTTSTSTTTSTTTTSTSTSSTTSTTTTSTSTSSTTSTTTTSTSSSTTTSTTTTSTSSTTSTSTSTTTTSTSSTTSTTTTLTSTSTSTTTTSTSTSTTTTSTSSTTSTTTSSSTSITTTSTSTTVSVTTSTSTTTTSTSTTTTSTSTSSTTSTSTTTTFPFVSIIEKLKLKLKSEKIDLTIVSEIL